MADDIEKFIDEFKKSMLANNNEFDDETETELRELLIDLESTISHIAGREKAKKLIRFVTKQLIVRPLVKKVFDDFIERNGTKDENQSSKCT